ncbi:MAG TPA: glycosyltransferase family A protein [Terracidiphilus sp.]|nr:glycosyltransferase family A protein [Terracidiphilus sp.]
MHKQSGPTVTIVICTRYNPVALRSCLEAIARLNPPADDVLVVDNSEGDAKTKLVASEFAVRYLVEAGAGLSRARNRGLTESSSEIVAYLDDDAMPRENWLEQILAPFADPRVASVTGDTIPPDALRNASEHCSNRSLSNMDPQWFEIATFGGLGKGTNMALRKAAHSNWKGFDVRLGRGAPLRIAEESHAFASLLALGYRAVHVPAAVVVHPSKPKNIEQEATSSIAYWLLLFFEFSGHRLELARFLFRRLQGKSLDWPRDPQTPGAIVSSGWRVRLKAGLAGTLLYLRSRRLRER